MKRSRIVKLRKLQDEWHIIKNKNKGESDPGLLFAVQWVDELRHTLFRYRNDHEFVVDIIATAAAFYNESMTDREKTDAFIFLLGKVVNK